MKIASKMVLLSALFLSAHANNNPENGIVTPSIYQPDHAVAGCDVKQLAANLTQACNKKYGSNEIEWQSVVLSRAICSGHSVAIGQQTSYSVLADIQPCPGSHGGVSASQWVCNVQVDTDYQVKALSVYRVTCSG